MRTVILIPLALAVLGATPAKTQPHLKHCGKRDDVVKLLDSKYQEQLTGFGVAGQSNIVEVYVSKNGSFTILATTTDGTTCIIAAGQSWEKVKSAETMSSI